MKPCKKCGATDRAKNGACRSCAKAYRKANRAKLTQQNKEWVAKNRDDHLVKRRARYEKNKDHLREKAVAYYYANRLERIEYSRRYTENNPDLVKQSQAKYRDANRDRRREYHRAYSKQNLERMSSYSMRRYEVSRKQPLSAGLRESLLVSQKYKCVGCGCDLRETKFHMDHIMPLKLGGPHTDDNIQLLCAHCNHRKSAKHPDVWRAELETANIR